MIARDKKICSAKSQGCVGHSPGSEFHQCPSKVSVLKSHSIWRRISLRNLSCNNNDSRCIYIYLFISHLNDDTVQIKMIMFPFTTIPGLHRIISEPSRHRRSRWTPALQRLQFPWQTMRIPIPLSRNDTRNDLVLWCNIMDFVLRFAQYWLKSQCQLCFTISPGIFSRKKLITKYRTRYSMYMCVYIYTYIHIYMVSCSVFLPPHGMGPQVAPPSLLFASYWPNIHTIPTIHAIHTIPTIHTKHTIHSNMPYQTDHTHHTYRHIKHTIPNILYTTPTIHTIPTIHPIHTIPAIHTKHTIHSKHTILTIPTIHAKHTIHIKHTVHEIITLSYIHYTPHHTHPTTPQGGEGDSTMARGAGSLDHIICILY